MPRGSVLLAAASLLFATAACTREARYIGAEPPLTAPVAGDRRVPMFQDDLSQVSQGGRYFGWYGCGGCHGAGARGVLDLGDTAWRHGAEFAQVYRAIATGHGALAYDRRIPVQQLWQLTAYVRDLPQEAREKLARQERDQRAEPTGARWSGPIREQMR